MIEKHNIYTECWSHKNRAEHYRLLNIVMISLCKFLHWAWISWWKVFFFSNPKPAAQRFRETGRKWKKSEWREEKTKRGRKERRKFSRLGRCQGALRLWLMIPAELLLEQGGMKNTGANQSRSQEERIPFGLMYDGKKPWASAARHGFRTLAVASCTTRLKTSMCQENHYSFQTWSCLGLDMF